MDELTHLVIVCCHAIYLGDGTDTSEKQWKMMDFQRSNLEIGKPSEHETFILHILAGVMLLQHDTKALLVFSGGKTTDAETSEAAGYEKVFLGLGEPLLGSAIKRYALETIATDSYQNLIFSILRFRQLVGRYPEQVTLITHAFKANRFLELHSPAIKWPADRIRVHGIDPNFTLHELRSTQKGELEKGYQLFEADRYGVGDELGGKRRHRKWDPARLERFDDVEPVVRKLLDWEGGEKGVEDFPETLPWEEGRHVEVR